MSSYFDLTRRFVERQKYDPDELIATEVSGKQIDWPGILANRFSIIVAPANYGKTTEMRHRATQLRAASEHAVFVELRRLADRKSFGKALEPDELDAYLAWKTSPSQKLTLFVDSLDEAAAGKKEDIEYLVSDVASEILWPNENVNWVISTRPAVLTAETLEKLTKILVTSPVRARPPKRLTRSPKDASELSKELSEQSLVDEQERLRLYSMAPLNSSQAEVYLKSKYGITSISELLRIARERGLAGFTNSPGGLGILSRIDLARSTAQSLTEVFQRVVEAVHELQRDDHRVSEFGSPNPLDFADAAQKLASASQVCQLVNIEMPEDKFLMPEKALSARHIAGSILTERALSQLLNSQLFIDVGFHQVKLYPDELTPFLAAQRLANLVQSPEHAHQLIQHFTWFSQTGEQGVYRQFLPLMGWLATLNSHCREEILYWEPQALAFFGDLRNSAVPLPTAEKALSESIRRLVVQGDRLGRGMFTLTSENFWQAGPTRLLPLLKNLFDEYGHNHWARDALIDIAIASRSDALRKSVLASHRNSYLRLLESSMDVRYILELGLNGDLEKLASALKASTNTRESLVATLIRRLGWTYFTAKEIATKIDELFTEGRGGYSIGYAFGATILDAATDEQLYELCRALTIRVSRLRDEHGRVPRTRGSADTKYIELALETATALVNRSTFTRYKRTAILCLILQRVVRVSPIGAEDRTELRKALQGNLRVRRALLALIVKQANRDEHKLWMSVFGFNSTCHIDASDVNALRNPLLTKIFNEMEETKSSQVSSTAATKRQKEDRIKVGPVAKKQLFGMLKKLRNGSAGNALAWVAGWLLQTNPSSRHGEIQFEIFELEVGPKIAEAVRAGFSHIWRSRPPLFKEDEPRSTYHITIAGLQALHLEFGEGLNLPDIENHEVRSALRYGVFEINGYPKWFWPLAVPADRKLTHFKG